MLKIRPIVTYALVSALVLWVLLGAVTLPNTNRWFRGSDYSIKEDIISFNLANNSNATFSVENSIHENRGDRDFVLNVYPIDNTLPVPNKGLKGVLYDIGESCSAYPNVEPVPLFFKQHANIPKIALIRQSTNCFLVDKILNAQHDGAIGAIIFHNLSVNEDLSAKYNGMGVMPKTVNISAYYIDLNSGLTLLKDIEDVYRSNDSTNNFLIRVTLTSNDRSTMDSWQFALLIVGVMLITSIITISVLQCHMWRIARHNSSSNRDHDDVILNTEEQNQITIDENYWRGIIGQSPRPLISQTQRRRLRLDQALVDLLPTRIYKKREAGEKEKPETVHVSTNSLIAKNQSVDTINTAGEMSSCVICLDSFASEEVLRRLQCNHEYHRDCIDIWLTKKCASCPLCQQIVQIPTVPDETHVRLEEDSSMYEPDLIERWSGMIRDEEVMMRQSSFAAGRNQGPQRESSVDNSFINPFPPI